MGKFIYCNDEKVFNELVKDGFIPLKECSTFILLNNKENARFEKYENITFSDTMCF